MSGEYHNINSSAPPFGNRSTVTDPPGLMDDPYRAVGGDPHPIVTNAEHRRTCRSATSASMDPGINSPRVQSWNVTVEQQLGSQWGVSAAYLGSHSDRLWAPIALNPGSLHGSRPLHAQERRHLSRCARSTPTSISGGRSTSRIPPRRRSSAGLDQHTDVGYQDYRGLKLSAVHRSTAGREPQRQLHAVALLRHGTEQPLHAGERRLRESGQPVV